MGRVFELHDPLRPRREHSLGEVRALRPPIVNPAHPSLYRSPVEMFDQDDPEVNAAHRCVLLTQAEAVRIAELLRCARGHLPSPKACDEAISLLRRSR